MADSSPRVKRALKHFVGYRKAFSELSYQEKGEFLYLSQSVLSAEDAESQRRADEASCKVSGSRLHADMIVKLDDSWFKIKTIGPPDKSGWRSMLVRGQSTRPGKEGRPHRLSVKSNELYETATQFPSP